MFHLKPILANRQCMKECGQHISTDRPFGTVVWLIISWESWSSDCLDWSLEQVIIISVPSEDESLLYTLKCRCTAAVYLTSDKFPRPCPVKTHEQASSKPEKNQLSHAASKSDDMQGKVHPNDAVSNVGRASISQGYFSSVDIISDVDFLSCHWWQWQSCYKTASLLQLFLRLLLLEGHFQVKAVWISRAKVWMLLLCSERAFLRPVCVSVELSQCSPSQCWGWWWLLGNASVVSGKRQRWNWLLSSSSCVCLNVPW